MLTHSDKKTRSMYQTFSVIWTSIAALLTLLICKNNFKFSFENTPKKLRERSSEREKDRDQRETRQTETDRETEWVSVKDTQMVWQTDRQMEADRQKQTEYKQCNTKNKRLYSMGSDQPIHAVWSLHLDHLGPDHGLIWAKLFTVKPV